MLSLLLLLLLSKVGLTAALTAIPSSTSSLITSNHLLFSFGFISDIQYADSDDQMNFQGTKLRRYRNSLAIYREAVRQWSAPPRPVDFAIILGDIIDGKAAFAGNQRECLQEVIEIGKILDRPKYYCFGNHCHYCFKRPDLRELLVKPSLSHFSDVAKEASTEPTGNLSAELSSDEITSSDGYPSNHEDFTQLHYHFSPYPGWRFVSLDAYDISTIGSLILVFLAFKTLSLLYCARTVFLHALKVPQILKTAPSLISG